MKGKKKGRDREKYESYVREIKNERERTREKQSRRKLVQLHEENCKERKRESERAVKHSEKKSIKREGEREKF